MEPALYSELLEEFHCRLGPTGMWQTAYTPIRIDAEHIHPHRLCYKYDVKIVCVAVPVPTTKSPQTKFGTHSTLQGSSCKKPFLRIFCPFFLSFSLLAAAASFRGIRQLLDLSLIVPLTSRSHLHVNTCSPLPPSLPPSFYLSA